MKRVTKARALPLNAHNSGLAGPDLQLANRQLGAWRIGPKTAVLGPVPAKTVGKCGTLRPLI